MTNQEAMDDDLLSFEALTFGERETKRNTSTNEEDESNESVQTSLESSALQLEAANDSENVVLITTEYTGSLPFTSVLKQVEQQVGATKIKQHNFKEKQTFAFVQMTDPQSVEKLIEKLHNFDLEGSKLTVERCGKITPGRDPRTHDFNSDFKNATLVLKNLPFQLKQEKLEEILNSYEWKPLNVSYLYDASGMFRGMAFVKYRDIEYAMKVFEQMNDMDISGRKVRIEYKRKAKDSDTPISSPTNTPSSPLIQDDESKNLYDQLANFRTSSLTEIALLCSSSYQRKQIHQIAEKLGLSHFSTGETESRYVVIKKKIDEKETSPGSNHKSGGQPIKSRRSFSGSNSDPRDSKQRHSYEAKTSSSPEDRLHPWSPPPPESKGISKSYGGGVGIGIPPSSRDHHGSYSGSSPAMNIKSPPFHSPSQPGLISGSPNQSSLLNQFGSSPSYRNSAAILNRMAVENGHASQPTRQPRGPDKSNGFSDEYKKQRIKQ